MAVWHHGKVSDNCVFSTFSSLSYGHVLFYSVSSQSQRWLNTRLTITLVCNFYNVSKVSFFFLIKPIIAKTKHYNTGKRSYLHFALIGKQCFPQGYKRESTRLCDAFRAIKGSKRLCDLFSLLKRDLDCLMDGLICLKGNFNVIKSVYVMRAKQSSQRFLFNNFNYNS